MILPQYDKQYCNLFISNRVIYTNIKNVNFFLCAYNLITSKYLNNG